MIFWIFFAIILAIYLIYYFIKKKIEKKEKQKIYNKLDENTSNIPIDIEELTQEEYQKKLLQLLQNMNKNIAELNYELTKQQKNFENIKDDVNTIMMILLIPIIIGLLTILISAITGTNIIKDIL